MESNMKKYVNLKKFIDTIHTIQKEFLVHNYKNNMM